MLDCTHNCMKINSCKTLSRRRAAARYESHKQARRSRKIYGSYRANQTQAIFLEGLQACADTQMRCTHYALYFVPSLV